MTLNKSLVLQCLAVFYLYLCNYVCAADEFANAAAPKRRGYSKGDTVPVSCLNRTIETGEHITDSHGNLQYIPFMTCNETNEPLSFQYNQPTTQTCTILSLSDELYHLIEYFVHSDVPLSCRVPSYPLTTSTDIFTSSSSTSPDTTEDSSKWTPFTIALQGTLQRSHLHLHTNVNALFHYVEDNETGVSGSGEKKSLATAGTSHLIGSTAYSLPDLTPSTPAEGTKIVRNEPLILTFNVGWIEGVVLPGMIGRPVVPKKVTDHQIGFSFLSITALGAAAGLGALGMLVYERRKRGRGMNGLLGGNVGRMNGGGGVGGVGGYGGYGGYSSGMGGKRD